MIVTTALQVEARPVSLGPEGQDRFSACGFGRDTESDLESRLEAVTKLELALANRKPAERAADVDSASKPGFRGKRGKTG